VKVNEDFTRRSRLEDLGRWYVTQFVEKVAASLQPGTLLLDAGAGECAYKRFFSDCRYFAIDLAVGDAGWNWANVDAFARLDVLPLPDESVDAILCTQVLEHLENPHASVQEFFRVLRKRGILYMTVPMAHREHQVPFDFFRYTSFGLRSLLRGAGFRDFEIAPFGGVATRMAYELPRLMDLFPGSGLKSGRVRIRGLALLPLRAASFMAIRLLQRFLLWADRFDRARDDPFGWSVIACR
jgi:SAM-dependent methyltransferase